jgi:uracil-DNA glycosylase family 4
MMKEKGEEKAGSQPSLETRFGLLGDEIIACRKCPRLVAYREEVGRIRRRAYRDQDYWAKPVPGFGDLNARVLVVGLAPGAHGSNRTGRMFTGDDSGVFLYRALFKAGFGNQPATAHRNDGLALKDIFISAVCRCAPPDNKPAKIEKANCQPYLEAEFKLLDHLEGIVALGRIAFEGIQSIYVGWGYHLPPFIFAHNALNWLGNGLPWLITSYHPSRQNTQTGRLTEAMFDGVWQQANRLLARG